MPDEIGRFGTAGLSWSQRALLGGLKAVIGPGLDARGNGFLHGIHTYGARRAAKLLPSHAAMVDFGCGNGRFTRFFADRGATVLGTEITPEMIRDAREACPDESCSFALTNGVAIPADDASLDAIWCCGVLRFSLFGDAPVHDQIAREMFRVLRPGGVVVNVEVYTDKDPAVFEKDFTAAGFRVGDARVLHRYKGRLERVLGSKRWPERLAPVLGELCARARYRLDMATRPTSGLRDYYLEYHKP